jgi:hypothetical protein
MVFAVWIVERVAVMPSLGHQAGFDGVGGVYRATTRSWSAELPFCPCEGHAMLTDHAVFD